MNGIYWKLGILYEHAEFDAVFIHASNVSNIISSSNLN